MREDGLYLSSTNSPNCVRVCCEKVSILRGDGGDKDSDIGTVEVNTRCEGRCESLVDSFEQVIAESADNRLYGPLPGLTGVYSTLFGRRLLGSCFGPHSSTSLGFAALLLRLTECQLPVTSSKLELQKER